MSDNSRKNKDNEEGYRKLCTLWDHTKSILYKNLASLSQTGNARVNGECAVYKRKMSTTPGKGDQDLEEVLTDTVLKLEEIDTDLYR